MAYQLNCPGLKKCDKNKNKIHLLTILNPQDPSIPFSQFVLAVWPPIDNYINIFLYSETLNNEYIERTHQMSYSSLSDNEMLQIFHFLIK